MHLGLSKLSGPGNKRNTQSNLQTNSINVKSRGRKSYPRVCKDIRSISYHLLPTNRRNHYRIQVLNDTASSSSPAAAADDRMTSIRPQVNNRLKRECQ